METMKSLWNVRRSKYWRRRQNDKNLILKLISHVGNIFEAQAFLIILSACFCYDFFFFFYYGF